MIRIDVFVLPGCAQCSEGLDALKQVARSFGPEAVQWRQRDLLQHIDDAVALGVLSTPAIAIDGKLAFTKLPSPQALHAALARAIQA